MDNEVLYWLCFCSCDCYRSRPLTVSDLSELCSLSPYRVRLELKYLCTMGYVVSVRWFECVKNRRVSVQGYIVTDKAKKTFAYAMANNRKLTLIKDVWGE